MQPFTVHTGLAVVLDRSDVDTDQIIPKQFLKRIERSGFGQFLFFDWRFLPDGTPNPEFELNRPENAGGTILISRRNFGSGSSREHAVWALLDYGFRAVIAESFSDIFYNNCFKNGVLPVVLEPREIDQLVAKKQEDPALKLMIDLAAQTVSGGAGFNARFDIDPIRKDHLLRGLDDIAMTMLLEDRITAWEERLRPTLRGPEAFNQRENGIVSLAGGQD
jgi:3-isopropylmalate/(R)-2-methylmalate dehydratase small subunit